VAVVEAAAAIVLSQADSQQIEEQVAASIEDHQAKLCSKMQQLNVDSP
jgi:hypothetical protein